MARSKRYRFFGESIDRGRGIHRPKYVCLKCRLVIRVSRNGYNEALACGRCGRCIFPVGPMFKPPPANSNRGKRSWETIGKSISYRTKFYALKRFCEWKGDMTDVANVSRKTLYGNPIKIGRVCPLCAELHSSAGSTLACYRIYLYLRLKECTQAKGQAIAAQASLPGCYLSSEQFSIKLMELRGWRLYCPGCEIDAETCHARVLEKAVNWLANIA